MKNMIIVCNIRSMNKQRTCKRCENGEKSENNNKEIKNGKKEHRNNKGVKIKHGMQE